MRLTQLKLSGFKSFVDPTSINVPGQLVGIVGPNGCGKSNVIDAVRWVLGETRASALRGDSMMDVIFNGSVNRKPLARASVELIFDNHQGRAAGQWSQYSEISVKRVLQRNGESAYYINNAHVRRRDITDMFLGTGLGPRAYAIIEQGMISRIIEAKPEELRVFLEEAAGISRYKERRRETENRLSDTRENLARVNDIRLELGGQLEKLEKQAEIASRFQDYQRELQLKQQMLWFLRRRDAAIERDRLAQDISRASTAVEAEIGKLREAESALEASRSAHYLAGDAMNATQAALYGANTDVARHESELRHAEESRHKLEVRHVELSSQLASWRSQRSQLTQALHLWASRRGGANALAAHTAAEAEEQGSKLPEAERLFRVTQDHTSSCRGKVLEAESRRQIALAGMTHVSRALVALEDRKKRLEVELSGGAPVNPSALEELLKSCDQAKTVLIGTESRVQELEEVSEECHSQLESVRSDMQRLERDQAGIAARLGALQVIQNQVESNERLQIWLRKHGLSDLPKLWETLRISGGWETAVESVLRERLRSTRLPSSELLASLISEAPPAKVVLYRPNQFRMGADKISRESLLENIQVLDDSLRGVLSQWLGNVFTTDVVPSEEEYARLPLGGCFVNRQGHQFFPNSICFHAADSGDSGLLARQREIEELEIRNRELLQRMDVSKEIFTQHERRYQETLQSLADCRQEVSDSQGRFYDLQNQRLVLQQSLEQHAERVLKIWSETEIVSGEMGVESERKLKIERDIEASIDELAIATSSLEMARTQLQEAEITLANRRVALQSAERAAQEAVFAQKECVSKITEIDSAVTVVDQQIRIADLELSKLAEELATDPIPALRALLESAVQVRIECEKSLSAARLTVEEAAAALRAFEEVRLELEGRINPLKDRIGELRLKEQAASINHDQFATQLREACADEEYLNSESAKAQRPSTIQGEILSLSQAISDLGAVNLAALEELRSGTERKLYLDSQSEDLSEAVQTLEDAIRRIDKDTRELLRETFDSVNRHFASLFPMLFGGGEAKLTMTGEEILDAGVQVIAQPPGKRNTSIHLLSGGEKALTAISLVFSLFQLNPAPFCLLDEVDAPLDDSNTQRFCDLVKRMSGQTQFLYISHNKITMEMASQLIGVTMQESGVSRVVDVDMDQALRIRDEIAA